MFGKTQIAVSAALALAAGLTLAIAGATLSVSETPQARQILEDIGLPQNAADVSDVKLVEADGTMPEMASRSIALAGDENAVGQEFAKRCQAAGFAAPEADAKQLEPDLICAKRTAEGASELLIHSQCADSVCKVMIESRYLHF
jgi:hypothetical protein